MSPNNTCDVYWQLYPDPSSSPLAIVSFSVLYSLIFLMGLIGNSALIYVTVRNRALQTVQNMFILNLAASDIIMCLLSVPLTPVTNIYKNWYFGAFLCRLIPCVQGISVFISTFSLGAIAFDRYVLVVRPHARRLSKRCAMIVTVILWALSIVVTLPYALFMAIESYPGVCGEFCTEKWPNASSRRAYTMVVLVAQFVIPFVMMAFCYASIFARLRTRARLRLQRLSQRSSTVHDKISAQSRFHLNESDAANNTNSDMHIAQEKFRHRVLKRTRRTTVVLVSMVLIFGFTWLPHNLVSMVIEYDDAERFLHTFGISHINLSYLINLFTHSVAMTNNVANPVLYAWLNPTFRDLVIQTCSNRYHPMQHRKAGRANANHTLKSSVIGGSSFVRKTSQMNSGELTRLPRSQFSSNKEDITHMSLRHTHDPTNNAIACEWTEEKRPNLTPRYRCPSSQRTDKDISGSCVLAPLANRTPMTATSVISDAEEIRQNATLLTVHDMDIYV